MRTGQQLVSGCCFRESISVPRLCPSRTHHPPAAERQGGRHHGLALPLYPPRRSGHRSINRLLRAKRELLRANKTAGIARLEAFVRATPGRYLPLSDEALRLAAELWAKARQAGEPTSDRAALDIDVIIAAQALSFGPAPSDVLVATTNAKHFTQFVNARDWSEIVP